MDTKPKVIQSVQRAIDILECFNYENKNLSLSEISEKLNLNPSTVHGILLTLQVNGYIEKIPEKIRYRLGVKLLEKGSLVLESMDLREIVRPYLEGLTNRFKETSHLCLYKNNSLYVIDKNESLLSTFFMTSEIGLKIPLHSSASGKLILAYIDERKLDDILNKTVYQKYTEKTLGDIESVKEDLKKIRKQGYSLEDEEIELGLYTIAAPIFNHKSEIIATIGVLGPTIRMKEKKEEIIKKILEYSREVSWRIGHKG